MIPTLSPHKRCGTWGFGFYGGADCSGGELKETANDRDLVEFLWSKLGRQCVCVYGTLSVKPYYSNVNLLQNVVGHIYTVVC